MVNAEVLREAILTEPTTNSNLNATVELLEDECTLVGIGLLPLLEHEHHVSRTLGDIAKCLVTITYGLRDVPLVVLNNKGNGFVIAGELGRGDDRDTRLLKDRCPMLSILFPPIGVDARSHDGVPLISIPL